MNDYLAERLRGLAYMSDDEWAQSTLREAADEIDRLERLITAWADADEMLLQFPFGLESAEAKAKADHHYDLKCDAQRALRKAVGR